MSAVREHGLYTTYVKGGCRCDACRAAHCDAVKARKERRRVHLVTVAGVQVCTANVRHGSVSTYVNWLCRCTPCKDASAEYHRYHRGVSS